LAFEVFLSLAWYGAAQQAKYVSIAIKRWIEHETLQQPLEYIPSRFLIYVVGIAAIANENWDYLVTALIGEPMPHSNVPSVLDYPSCLIFEKTRFHFTQGNIPTGVYSIGKQFYSLIRPLFERFLSHDDFERTFYLFEFVLVLQILHSRQSKSPLDKFMVERTTYYHTQNAESFLLHQLEKWGRAGEHLGLLKAGLFDGSITDFKQALIEHYQRLEARHRPITYPFHPGNYLEAYLKGLGED
jgi:hypothetical protein